MSLWFITQSIHRYVLASDISADMDHLILNQSVEMTITPGGVHSRSFKNIKPCTHVIGLQPADDLLLRWCAETVDHSHAQGHLLKQAHLLAMEGDPVGSPILEHSA